MARARPLVLLSLATHCPGRAWGGDGGTANGVVDPEALEAWAACPEAGAAASRAMLCGDMTNGEPGHPTEATWRELLFNFSDYFHDPRSRLDATASAAVTDLARAIVETWREEVPTRLAVITTAMLYATGFEYLDAVPTCEQVDVAAHSFCFPGFLTGLYVLGSAVGVGAEERDDALSLLCELFDQGRFSSIMPGLDFALARSRWGWGAVDLLELLSRHGRLHCVAPRIEWRHLLLRDAAPLPPRRAAGPTRFHVAGIGGHNFIHSCVLATRDGTEAAGLIWEGGVFGYGLQHRFKRSEQMCTEMDAKRASGGAAGAGPWCRQNDFVARITTTIAMREVVDITPHQRGFRAALDADAFLRQADLIICGYPYLACVIFGDLEEAAHLPMIIAHRTNSLVEYAGALVRPGALQVLQRWVHGKQRSTAFRRVLGLDPISTASTRLAFGAEIEEAPYGSHHVRLLSGPVDCVWRGRTELVRPVLISKLVALLPMDEVYLVQGIIDTGFEFTGFQPVFAHEYDYRDLSTFVAAVLFPWDWALVTFIEWYRIGLPMLLPDARWMHAVIMTELTYGRNLTMWPKYRHRRFQMLMPEQWAFFNAGANLGNMSLDWVEDGPHRPPLLEQISRWWSITEFERFRHVKHFSSVAHMRVLLNRMEPGRMCRRIERQNAADLRRSARYHESLVRQIVAGPADRGPDAEASAQRPA